MRRFFVELPEDVFSRLVAVAERERRAVQDQAAVFLEELLAEPDKTPAPAGALAPRAASHGRHSRSHCEAEEQS